MASGVGKARNVAFSTLFLQERNNQKVQGRIQEFRKGVGAEGGCAPTARSAEALSNIAILTHIHNEKLALIT